MWNRIFINNRIDENRKRINICFGGIDNHNLAEKLFIYLNHNLDLINDKEIKFDIISDHLYNKYQNKKIDSHFNIYPKLPIENIVKLLSQTYISIGASGISIYERCVMNIFNIVITIADYQIGIAKKIDELGYGIYLGSYEQINFKKIIDIINNHQECKNRVTLDQNHYQKILSNIEDLF